MAKTVTVLMGGWSTEREVSLSSGEGCAKGLSDAGYDVSTIDVTHDLSALLDALATHRPDVVFNALHGRFGEDGCIQGLLDMLNLPYTHSGRLASALAMDKIMARAVFAAEGLPLAEGQVIQRDSASNRPTSRSGPMWSSPTMKAAPWASPSCSKATTRPR